MITVITVIALLQAWLFCQVKGNMLDDLVNLFLLLLISKALQGQHANDCNYIYIIN